MPSGAMAGKRGEVLSPNLSACCKTGRLILFCIAAMACLLHFDGGRFFALLGWLFPEVECLSLCLLALLIA
jgi:hypothetical protein